MRPLLFTTIPPRHRGVHLDAGAPDCRPMAVLRSWRDGGFAPVSVNLADEVSRHPDLPATLRACGVETLIATPRDGATPGPLCPIVDFLRVIGDRAGDAPFAIINADIAIAPSRDRRLAAEVASLGEREHLVAQRTDVTADGTPDSIFANGFDFMAMRGSCVARVLPFLAPGLAFGRPWWDHYLPLALIALGSRTRLLDPAWFRHEIHPFRWNKRQYCSIGRQAMERFREAAGRVTDRDPARDWFRAVESGLLPESLPASLARTLRRIALHPAAPDVVAASVLKRLAAANMRLILQSAHRGESPDGTLPGSPASG